MNDNTQFTHEKIEWINSRRSMGTLMEPAPSNEQLKYAIACAMSAPDHKKLQPWRFSITQGKQREKLAAAFLQAATAKAQREGSTLTEEEIAKINKMPLRAPTVITVTTRFSYHEKVPQFEQMLSTGACVQNLILALQAMGYASIWRTGLLTNEAALKSYFNVAGEDYIAGFIYVGTSKATPRTRLPIDTAGFIVFDNA